MTWEYRLPWTTPPLTENQRLHWRKRAVLVRAIRGEVSRACALSVFSDNEAPNGADHVVVELHYWPRDRRRRDADNLVPTLKAACDGLVDGNVVPDDTPAWMTKRMPVIHEPDGDPRLVLRVEETSR